MRPSCNERCRGELTTATAQRPMPPTASDADGPAAPSSDRAPPLSLGDADVGDADLAPSSASERLADATAARSADDAPAVAAGPLSATEHMVPVRVPARLLRQVQAPTTPLLRSVGRREKKEKKERNRVPTIGPPHPPMLPHSFIPHVHSTPRANAEDPCRSGRTYRRVFTFPMLPSDLI